MTFFSLINVCLMENHGHRDCIHAPDCGLEKSGSSGKYAISFMGSYINEREKCSKKNEDLWTSRASDSFEKIFKSDLEGFLANFRANQFFINEYPPFSKNFFSNLIPYKNMVFKNVTKKYNLLNEKEKKLVFYCRTKDEGSVVTSEKLTAVKSQLNENNIISFGGAGYLFDNISYDLTKNLFVGLLFAIISIGLIFFFLNNYSIPYFIIAIIPNIIPIVVCLGILFCFDFYFSLSNAFIFTIVFGLIIDDSIHLISAYTNSIKKGNSKETALKAIVTQTGSAILKTTLLIILCLTPLLFSEFKSVSQLAEITMLSASIALFFDLIFIPKLIRLMIR